MKSPKPDGIVLFSGGLDSILAARLLEEQGLKIRCLHFHTPFFGSPGQSRRWLTRYGLEVVCRDASQEFVEMLARKPAHRLGKTMNPCVDCKILLLTLAKQYMDETGASFVATGEVLGQRPMSQRRDSLNLIARDAGLKGQLLRPLSALHMEPVQAEISGLVNREQLCGMCGRGRDSQMELAKKFALSEIPSPAGGCLLTERENGRRYWPILRDCWESGREDFAQLAQDFDLASTGRQFRRRNGGYWLCVGRNSGDNARLVEAAREKDIILRLVNLAGPLALARRGTDWPQAVIEEAAAMAASFAPKAVATGSAVRMRAKSPQNEIEFMVFPTRDTKSWQLPSWEETKSEIKSFQRNWQSAC